MKKYIVEENTLRALLRANCQYSALEYAGVDSWIGYDLANDKYRCGLQWEDIVETHLASFKEYKEDEE